MCSTIPEAVHNPVWAICDLMVQAGYVVDRRDYEALARWCDEEVEPPRLLNPWDALMVCGHSWADAEILIRLWAKENNVRVAGLGKRSGRSRRRQ
jgi:hypothetical protein